jgi:hypothetical protein
MNNVITRTAEMFVRVRDFSTERAGSFTTGSLGAEQFAIVADTIETLTNEITTQTTGKSSVQQATASRTGAREALRASLQAIAQTARAMALDTPGLENKFRMPRSGSDQALLYAARAFAADAAPLKAEFLRHELHASFIEDLQAEIADLERAMGGQNTGRDAHVTATASADSTVERGMNAVRRLDAIVRNKYRDDRATLAAWESARHVEARLTIPLVRA